MYPPVAPTISLGPLTLTWYGLFMATAVITGAWIASKEIERRGKDPEDFWDMLIWVLLPAFFGARLYYVFIQSGNAAYYLANPLQVLMIWTGGIHIFGAFIFGSIALWLFTKIRRLPTLTYLDAAAVGLPIAQAIGRWGNFINQELYGPPTDWPLGLRIDANRRLPPYDATIPPNCGPINPPNCDLAYPVETTRFHALFLYESVWNLLGFLVLYFVSKRLGRKLRPGDLSLLYLVWYPFGRFFIEFLRTDSWFFPGTPFNVVHVLSLVAIVGAVATLVLRRRLGKAITN